VLKTLLSVLNVDAAQRRNKASESESESEITMFNRMQMYNKKILI
jgi:hypothetical protein